MIDGINKLCIDIASSACICGLRINDIYQKDRSQETQTTKEENASILDFGRFFFGGDGTSPAVGKTALGVELSPADGFRGCECHDAKSCRCIVALKEAASFKSFDIAVKGDLGNKDVTPESLYVTPRVIFKADIWSIIFT